MNHIAFPSIGQFRQTIKHIKDSAKYHDVPLPTIKFEGTVKIHGTNAGVVRTQNGVIYAQSRERIITPESDNMGFAAFVKVNEDYFNTVFDYIKEVCGNTGESIQLYGEWFGKGIQKGVGVSEVEKHFTIFKVRISDNAESQNWLNAKDIKLISYIAAVKSSKEKLVNVSTIYDFPTYTVEVDFNNPELSQNNFIELTEHVERDCPVARTFLPDAPEGSLIGEGLVWTAIECSEPKINIDGVMFKTKGEKHSVSKVKTLVAIDLEKVASVDEFVEKTVTENRLKQGIDKLGEMGLEIDSKNTGDYLKWVMSDVFKEELETLVGSGLTTKDVSGKMATKARTYFLNYIK